MCDSVTMDLISDVVREFCDHQKLFTAFEVTLEVQARLRSQGLDVPKHNEIKRDIHKAMLNYLANDLYESRFTDVGAPVQALLYYPVGADYTQYQPLSRQNPTGTAPAPTAGPALVSASVVTPAADDDEDEADLLPDGRGTVCIPARFIRSIGGKDGKTVFVSPSTSKGLLLSLTSGPSDLTGYTVDLYDNVRVTAKTFDKVGISTYSDKGLRCRVVGQNIEVWG